MKRLILSFIILALLICYNLFSEKYVLSLCEDLDKRLEMCAANIKENDLSAAESNISELLDFWQERDIFLSVIIGDQSLTEPQKSIISIYYCLRDENYEACLQGIRECQGYIREIYDNTRTDPGNVM